MLKKFFTRFYLLVLALAPAFWLLFSTEGQRFFDINMLKLFKGRSEFNIKFEGLSPALDEQTVLKNFPEIEFQCQDQPTPWGDRTCGSDIAAFNGTPARYVTFFFYNQHLTAMKLGYQRAYHQYAVDLLTAGLGEPQATANAGVAQWPTTNGMFIGLRQQLQADQEPALLWLAQLP